MAQDVTVAGASYTGVPAVNLPKSGGGTATFYDEGSLPDMTGADGTNAGARGFVPAPAATDNVKFLRGDGSWATVSAGVTGVKGDAESTYRTGNVNLTAANIGALPSTTVIPTKTSDLTNDSLYGIPYGECSTAAGTQKKTVTVSPAITSLTAGQVIAVKFSYHNGADFPMLNVNSLGQKFIYTYDGTDYPYPGSNAALSWQDGQTMLFRYDGTYWVPLTKSRSFPIVSISTTLYASSWNSTTNTQTRTVSGVTSSNTVIVAPAPADMATWLTGNVRCTAQASNSLTFTADTNPTANITVNIVIVTV